jgi:hypothetical protein
LRFQKLLGGIEHLVDEHLDLRTLDLEPQEEHLAEEVAEIKEEFSP